MKRILTALLCVLALSVALVGCGKDSGKTKRELYNSSLAKYVELADYKGIKVDTKGDSFAEYYDAQIQTDVENNKLYQKKTEGTVQSGDTANIDYCGKKDGVAFDGGTAQGYDLVIGSGNFIEGFEDGLIGVQIGSTVDLNLTFPENYQSADLAGKAVVFTVTVNYVTGTDARAPEDYYKELGFDLLKAYTDDVTERAVKQYLYDKVIKDSKIKDYPEEDEEKMLNAYVDYYDAMYKQNYNVDLETALSASNMTLDSFKKQIKESSLPEMMNGQMVMYSILDNESLTFDDSNIKNSISKPLSETLAVEDAVKEYLYKNAVIK